MLNDIFWRCLVSTRSMENRVANVSNGTTYNDHCIYTTITSISTDSTTIYSDIRLNRFTCAHLSNLQELYDETLWIHVRSQFDDLKDCDMMWYDYSYSAVLPWMFPNVLPGPKFQCGGHVQQANLMAVSTKVVLPVASQHVVLQDGSHQCLTIV